MPIRMPLGLKAATALGQRVQRIGSSDCRQVTYYTTDVTPAASEETEFRQENAGVGSMVMITMAARSRWRHHPKKCRCRTSTPASRTAHLDLRIDDVTAEVDVEREAL